MSEQPAKRPNPLLLALYTPMAMLGFLLIFTALGVPLGTGLPLSIIISIAAVTLGAQFFPSQND